MTAAISSSFATPPAVSLRTPAAKAAAPVGLAGEQIAEDFRTARRDIRSMVKAHAKEKALRLREELRQLSRLLSGNPKEMARQVARIAKELRSVLKEFGDAHKGDVQDAAMTRELAPASGDPAQASALPERSLEARRREAGLDETPEALEMKSFVQEVRGMLKKLREVLQEAKVKAGAAAQDDDKQHNPFDAATKNLRDLEHDLDQAFRDASAEAKVFDAPAAGAPGSIVSVRV